MLRRSRFAHLYQWDNDVALFHSLTTETLFSDSRLVDDFLSYPNCEGVGPPQTPAGNGMGQTLREKGFLVESPAEDETLLAEYRRRGEFQHRGQLSLMYLIPASNCNLACSYCFIASDCRELAAMSLDTARQAVHYFFHHSQKTRNRKIIFYGGEPLLNPAAILAAADEATRLNTAGRSVRPLSFVLLTNGVLLTPELAQELAARKFSVSVSIDGPPDVHDAHRKTRDGRPTWSQARAALEMLRRAGLQPSASCTVTPTSLDSWNRVVDFIVDDLKVRGLGFNILLPGPCAQEAPLYPDQARPTEAIIDAFRRFRELGIYEDRVMRRVKPFAARRFHFKDCLGVGGQIAVRPDGRLGPCQGLLADLAYVPLHVRDDFERSPYSHPLFAEWTRRFPLNFDECLACPAVAICGGGCPIAALRETGSIWDIDRRICHQVIPMHEWLVWELLQNTKAGQA